MAFVTTKHNSVLKQKLLNFLKCRFSCIFDGGNLYNSLSLIKIIQLFVKMAKFYSIIHLLFDIVVLNHGLFVSRLKTENYVFVFFTVHSFYNILICPISVTFFFAV